MAHRKKKKRLKIVIYVPIGVTIFIQNYRNQKTTANTITRTIDTNIAEKATKHTTVTEKRATQVLSFVI